MKRAISTMRSISILFGFFMVVIFIPARAFAVVGDVTLTGLPPNTSITLTNETTGAKEERKTDSWGTVVIPLTGKNWQSGSYTVTATNPRLFPGTPRRTIQLTDGPNRVDLSTLVAMMGGIEVNVGVRFFDGALPINPSPAIRVLYNPPLVCCQETFSLSPYLSAWTIPTVNIKDHKAIDHVTFQNKVSDGTIWGFNAGLMHESNLAKWGISTSSADILGILMIGLGYVRYDFDMKRLAVQENINQNARGFNSTDNALRFEFNAGLSAKWGSYSLGIRGGAAPTRTDIFNGGNRWRTEGNVGLVGKYNF